MKMVRKKWSNLYPLQGFLLKFSVEGKIAQDSTTRVGGVFLLYFWPLFSQNFPWIQQIFYMRVNVFSPRSPALAVFCLFGKLRSNGLFQKITI